jgi:hypothetical protein
LFIFNAFVSEYAVELPIPILPAVDVKKLFVLPVPVLFVLVKKLFPREAPVLPIVLI